ncbi:MAG TPA: hypothetical protein VM581_02470 [Magnetospirillaceae bacterium]|nr:hypothetical protein [Magnetospirillaceae bacterium]
MTTYKRFIFDSYKFDPTTRTIALHYGFDDALHFTETITLSPDTPLEYTKSADFDRALFALHLAGGASYYKAFAPPHIEVRSGQLAPDQADFWNEFYTKGLGEYFYQNKIDWHGLIRFPRDEEAQTTIPHAAPRDPKNALVPFGGGKDSQTTVELLKHAGIQSTLFRMQGHAFITELAELNDLPLIEVSRALDPQLFELNKQGALNGHIPITGYVTFLTLVVGILHGFDSIFFSNERSSDYGNVEYLGMQVNHQWSKSNEAERMMTEYIEAYITHKTRYLNALRPLSELHIAKLFTHYPQYFRHITSCNRNWLWNKLGQDPHQGRWCGECDKCAFVFAMFAAFLPLNTLVDIFKKNLFDDAALLSTYRQLWGAEAFKPFQCVGTPEETQAAIYLASRSDDYANTVIGREFIQHELPKIQDPQALVKAALTPDFSDVPPYIATLIKRELTS